MDGYIVLVKRPKNVNTIHGRKNEYNISQPDTFLKHLLGSCLDLEKEATMLQSYTLTKRVKVDQAPKCHSEIAGEGIKYSLTLATKNFFWIKSEVRNIF